jgi:hypothetical protein
MQKFTQEKPLSTMTLPNSQVPQLHFWYNQKRLDETGYKFVISQFLNQ